MVGQPGLEGKKLQGGISSPRRAVGREPGRDYLRPGVRLTATGGHRKRPRAYRLYIPGLATRRSPHLSLLSRRDNPDWGAHGYPGEDGEPCPIASGRKHVSSAGPRPWAASRR